VPDCLSRCIPIEQRINQHNIPLHEIVPAAEIMSMESKDLREIRAEAQVEDKELQIIRQQMSEDLTYLTDTRLSPMLCSILMGLETDLWFPNLLFHESYKHCMDQSTPDI
jgi:hypothetical protein